MARVTPELVHGTAIAIKRRAALIIGASGTGKSDLALRCLTHARSPLIPEPAVLVADDQVLVERVGASLIARAPDALKGKLEVRGVGIIDVPAVWNGDVTVALVVELVEASLIARLPDPTPLYRLACVELPLLRVAPMEASAPTKVLLALGRRGGP